MFDFLEIICFALEAKGFNNSFVCCYVRFKSFLFELFKSCWNIMKFPFSHIFLQERIVIFQSIQYWFRFWLLLEFYIFYIFKVFKFIKILSS